ncbi:Beta-lactamase [Fulvivirga imtechensis AK7]|uniref:Beta-lactamase n=1 Tax=Fulvivirga imtechensis AK7 TaxID=1237149 RepID=L8JJ14_9BACT|nr:cyclic peptide export ABC transporter [Fulvivirga imtechensis]ELR68780.1 Beta-lactamase [Fulvivirga imtechensis AK7]
MMKKIAIEIFFMVIFLLHQGLLLGSTEQWKGDIEKEVQFILKEGEIPGMSLVVIYGGEVVIKSYGYADLESRKKLTEETLFQLASCSKAFTALAVAKLQKDGYLNPESKVSEFLPWFVVYYKGKKVDITISQLLHHTSGIPWNTIAKIPESNAQDALERTVKTLIGIKLHRYPGKQYEYATINYDILALIIEKVTGETFETYMQEEIFNPLGLNSTSVGIPSDSSFMAKGYKLGFFRPREYHAPIYKGNNAAGYIVSNANDMSEWLKMQMQMREVQMYDDLIKMTHQRDESVAPMGMSWYAGGWQVSISGDGVVYHEGMNPNFTSFVGFNAKKKYGVVLLANSNSNFTSHLGHNILRILDGREAFRDIMPDDHNDNSYSLVSLFLGFFILSVLVFLAYALIQIFKGKRVFEPLNPSKGKEILISLTLIALFLYGLYKLPNAMAGFTWEAALVWSPFSFFVLILLILASVAITYVVYLITLVFPDTNKHKRVLPKVLLLSALSGIANMVLILLITQALNSSIELKFLVFYFVLTLALYLVGRRFVQVSLIKLTRGLIYDLRVQLTEKIFKTSYQRFEKIDRGRVYTAYNDDLGTIGDSVNMFVMLVTNIFTAIAAFIYLATMAFWATALMVFLILSLTSLYYIVSRSTAHLFEEARDTRTVFMRLLNGMVDGFKEISLHVNKKLLYKDDVAGSANAYRQKVTLASIRYVNASLIGETVLVLILGTAAFAFPLFFPEIEVYTITGFIIVLLYLIGPVNAILASVPAIMRLRIAWNRVQDLLKEIPANCELPHEQKPRNLTRLNSIKVKNIRFRYDNEGEHQFEVGPINLEVTKGEILFIIGGNGSGKTTLSKLLTGLYEPDEGMIYIDEKEASSAELGELFSTVFNPFYLFEKLYAIDVSQKGNEIQKYLDLLDLSEKVKVREDGTFSTINLSGGQRKRLALLLCYLEDSPIYLFDEWAADQDPEYRKFFYRTLLPRMKEEGKLIIAITHDDHYFDVADHVVKMDQGKMEKYTVEDQNVAEVGLS